MRFHTDAGIRASQHLREWRAEKYRGVACPTNVDIAIPHKYQLSLIGARDEIVL